MPGAAIPWRRTVSLVKCCTLYLLYGQVTKSSSQSFKNADSITLIWRQCTDVLQYISPYFWVDIVDLILDCIKKSNSKHNKQCHADSQSLTNEKWKCTLLHGFHFRILFPDLPLGLEARDWGRFFWERGSFCSSTASKCAVCTFLLTHSQSFFVFYTRTSTSFPALL